MVGFYRVTQLKRLQKLDIMDTPLGLQPSFRVLAYGIESQAVDQRASKTTPLDQQVVARNLAAESEWHGVVAPISAHEVAMLRLTVLDDRLDFEC